MSWPCFVNSLILAPGTAARTLGGWVVGGGCGGPVAGASAVAGAGAGAEPLPIPTDNEWGLSTHGGA